MKFIWVNWYLLRGSIFCLACVFTGLGVACFVEEEQRQILILDVLCYLWVSQFLVYPVLEPRIFFPFLSKVLLADLHFFPIGGHKCLRVLYLLSVAGGDPFTIIVLSFLKGTSIR